jgi:hypothetical protein
MLDLQVLFHTLLGRKPEDRIPNAMFSADELAQEAIRISAGSTDTSLTTETDDAQIERWLKEIAASFNNDAPNKVDDFSKALLDNDMLNAVVGKFVTKLTTATDTLRSVKEDVTGIVADIEKAKDSILGTDIFATTYLTECSQKNISYDVFPFAIVDRLGSVAAFMNYVASVTGQSEEAILQSRAGFDIAFDRFSVKKLDNSESIKAEDVKVVLTEEQMTALVDGLTATLKQELTEDQIKIGVFLALNPDALRAKLNAIKYAVKYNEVTDMCIELIATIQVCDSVARKVASTAATLDGVSAETMTLLDKYSVYAASLAELAALAVQWNRVYIFKNTLVFRNKMLNPDKMSAMKDAGITMDDITAHIRANYSSTPIPSVGISTTVISNNKVRIAEEATKKFAQDTLRYKAIVVRAEQEAFVRAMYSYLSIDEHRAKVQFDDYLRSYLTKKSTHMAVQNAACEDVVYDTIISLLYQDSFVSVLHKRLGIEYVNLIANNKALSACDVVLANVSVYAELITEFMCKMFMKQNQRTR